MTFGGCRSAEKGRPWQEERRGEQATSKAKRRPDRTPNAWETPLAASLNLDRRSRPGALVDGIKDLHDDKPLLTGRNVGLVVQNSVHEVKH